MNKTVKYVERALDEAVGRLRERAVCEYGQFHIGRWPHAIVRATDRLEKARDDIRAFRKGRRGY